MANNGSIGIVQSLKMKEGRKYALWENESYLSEYRDTLMSRCRLEGGQESPGFRRGEVQSLTWTAGSSIACVIAFPPFGAGDIIGLLGLGSVAISFAFQDIFKNFLAGILLLLH